MASYYISNSGDDSLNDGLSTSTPWKTLAKISTEITAGTFLPGDNIYLNKGDVWNEDFTIDSLNGASSNYITFSAYGNANDPLPEITCVADLPGWQTSGNWTSDGNNAWTLDFTSANLPDKVRRVWIDGVEEGSIWWYDKLFPEEAPSITDFASAPGHDQWAIAVNSTFKLKLGPNSKTQLQLYSPNGNPASNFSSMLFYTSRSNMIQVTNSSYLIFENIKTTGGSYASIIFYGGHDIEVKNNDFCDRASASGVVVRTDSGADAYNITVHNNIINTRYTRYDPYRYSNIQFGVEFDYGAHDCEVYENSIIGVTEAAFRIYSDFNQRTVPTHDITFRDNYINGSGQRYGVAVNMHAGDNPQGNTDDPTPYNIFIYRNKFFWTTKNFQYGIRDSYIHHNIFYNNWGQAADTRVNHHYESCVCAQYPDNCGPNDECYGHWETVDSLSKPCDMLSEGGSVGRRTHYFNNTHYNIGNYSIFQNSNYQECFISNNLFVRANRKMSSTSPNPWRWTIWTSDVGNSQIFRNNWIAPSTEFPSYNDEFIAYGATTPGYPDYILTVPEFNAKGTTTGDDISGNYLSTEVTSSLINESDFSLPTGSSALDGGTDITSYMTHVPGFTDINENVVNLTSPNVGAIDNTPSSGSVITADQSSFNYTQDFLNYLRSLPLNTSNKVLSGQEGDDANGPSQVVADIYSQSGLKPAIIGMDYKFLNDVTAANNYAIDYFNNGGRITVSYHGDNPVTGGNRNDNTYVDFVKLITEGDPLNDVYKAQLDEVAAGLQQLQDANVPVLYRHMHEMNGGWFWWGDKNYQEYINVWIYTFNYLTQTKGLHNILFVYSLTQNFGDYLNYYAGDNYVDVVGLDYYSSNGTLNKAGGYDELQTLDKPFAITEYGPCPSDGTGCDIQQDDNNIIVGIKANMPNTIYWNSWSGQWSLPQHNNVSTLLHDNWVITQDEVVYSSGGINAPTNLQAVVNGTDVTLTWTDNSDNETAFVIAKGDGTEIDSVGTDVTQYIMTGLSYGVHDYKVKAINVTEESHYSNTVQANITTTSEDSWKLIGHGGGGYFRTIRFGQDENYIASGGDRCAVYASIDKGASWQDGGAGLLHGRVEQIAVNPQNRNEMICATMGGVFKSTDNGNSWVNIFTDVFTPARETINSAGYISAVAYNKTDPTIMYAANGGYHAQAYKVDPFRFFRSTDSGATWTTITAGDGSGLLAGDDTAFNIDTAENDANTVFVATKEQLYKSTDAGVTFTPLTSVTDGAMFVMVKPDDSNTVFYGLYGDYYNPQNYARNLYKSEDGGTTWLQSTNGMDFNTSYAVEMHYDPMYKTELYVAISNGTTTLGNQIYKSTDNGANWAAIGFTSIPANASNGAGSPKAFDIYNGNLVFCRNTTMFTSDAHTLTAPDSSKWTGVDADVVTVNNVDYFKGRGNEFFDLFQTDVHPTDHDIIFGAVADERLIKSADSGNSWKNMDPPEPYTNGYTDGNSVYHDPIKCISAASVAFCSTNDNVAFLSCYDQGGGASSDKGVLLRTENANSDTPTWTTLDATSGLPYAPGNYDSRRLWEVVSNDRGDMFTCAYGAIYRSLYSSGSPNDVGKSWTQVGTAWGNQGSFAIAPSDNSVMYYAMAAVNDPGIWQSTDWGATWAVLSFTQTDMIRTTGLAVDPTDPNIVWATQSSHSTDNAGKGGLWKIDVTNTTVTKMFAQTTDSDGISVPYADGKGIVIDSSDNNKMIMATHDLFQFGDYTNVWKGQGIWYSLDAGSSWDYIKGVGHNTALGVSLNKYKGYAYIGVDQRSAYQIDFAKLNNLTASISQSPSNTVIENNMVTYTCTTNAVSPTYQWYKNDVAVGTNSDTYAFNAVLGDDGSTIKCNILDGTSNRDSNILVLQVGEYTTIAAPTNLQATISEADIILTWTDNSDNETGFEIWDGTTQIDSVGINVTQYIMSNADSGTYNFKVRAVDSTSSSDYSNTVQVTMIEAPSNLQVFIEGSTATLNWVDNSSNETGFEIRNGDNYIASVGANVTQYVAYGLASGTYYFRVRAFNSSTASVYSNTVQATVAQNPLIIDNYNVTPPKFTPNSTVSDIPTVDTPIDSALLKKINKSKNIRGK